MFASRSRRHHRRQPQRRHSFEALETRRVLATYFVTTTSDTSGGTCVADNQAASVNCSLRDAITAAQTDTVADRIEIPAGTYALSLGSLNVSAPGDIAFVGTGATASDVAIDTGLRGRAFDLFLVSATSNLSFSKLTIQNTQSSFFGGDGFGGGGILAGSNVALSVTDVRFVGNQAMDDVQNRPGRGGAIEALGSLIIVDSFFQNNFAGASGGAISFRPTSSNSELTVSNSTFMGNVITNSSLNVSGGAIAAEAPAGERITADLTGNDFLQNIANGRGGALAFNSVNATISGGNFSSNIAAASIGMPANATAVGGAIAINGSLSISGNTRFGGNRTDGNGGVVAIRALLPSDSLTIDNVTFDTNGASLVSGGAIFMDSEGVRGSTASISRTTFNNNFAGDSGGAVFLNHVTNVNVDDVNFTMNRAQGLNGSDGVGGGLYVRSIENVTGSPDSITTINNSRFSNNDALGAGAGAIIINVPESIITVSRFDTNTVSGNGTTLASGGGGLAIHSDTADGQPGTESSSTIQGTTITNNSAPAAGGISIVNATVEILNSTISNNTATESVSGAGGIGVLRTTPNTQTGQTDLLLRQSIVANNTAAGLGGGIGAIDASILVQSSTLSGNTANGGSGGGIGLVDTSMTLSNVTVSGNTAATTGGGIAFSSNDPLRTGDVSFSTIASNSAGQTGSNVAVASSVVRFLSNIIADPRGSVSAANFVSFPGTLSSQGFNLVSDGSSSFASQSDQVNTDPLLGPLQDNGGPVFTRALLAGSPAIDAGAAVPLSMDARGVTRPLDGNGDGTARNDIGAFEAEAISGSTTLTIADVSVNESATSATVTVTSSAPLSGGFTVLVSTDGSLTATAGVDYTTTSATLTFAGTAGETQSFSVPIISDSIVEGDEQFLVRLSTPSSPSVVATDTGIVTILDTAVGNSTDLFVSISASASIVAPGNTLTYTVILDNAGPNLATDVGAVVTLPAGVTFQSGTLNGSTVGVSTSGDLVIANLSSLPADSIATLSIIVVVGTTTSGVLSTSASISANETDTNPGNNTDSVAVTVSSTSQTSATITTGNSDGDLTVTVDGFGAFGSAQSNAGQALFDPIGPIDSASTVFRSFSAFRLGESGSRILLSTGATSAPVVQGTSNQVTSSFNIGSLRFDLVQLVRPRFDAAGLRSGAELVQTYTVTNESSASSTVDLVRYVDGDLFFDGTLIDGGGLLTAPDGSLVLFETDRGGSGATDTTFVGISSQGGSTPTTDRFDIDGFSTLRSRIESGNPLRDAITGDTDSDNFVDVGREYDVALALRRLLSIGPGQSSVYSTVTAFGQRPDSIITPTVPGQISGHVFCDTNANGSEENGEAMPGVRVFLDTNSNRVLDSGERQTTTNSGGDYLFDNVVNSQVVVVADVPALCNAIPTNVGVVRNSITVGNLARSLATADVDNDGDLDLLVASDLSNSVAVLENTSGSFDLVESFSVVERPQSIAVWQNSSSGGASDLPVIAVAGIGGVASSGGIDVFENGQINRFPAGNGPIDVAIDDFNADGQPDFVVASFRSSDLTLFLSGVPESPQIATGANVRAVTVGQFDFQSGSDIVFASAGYAGDETSQITLLRGDNSGEFTTAATITAERDIVALAAVDVDFDGVDEVFALSHTGRLLGYRFSSSSSGSSGNGFELFTSIDVGAGASSMAFGRFNQDGILDVAIANLGNQSIDLLIGNSSGAFVSVATISNVTAPADLVVADFDGDLVDEIAVANLYHQAPEFASSPTAFQTPSTVTLLKLNVAEQEVRVSQSGSAVDFRLPNASAELRFDVNGDAQITAGDALEVLATMNRTEAEGEQTEQENRQRADVDGNGRVSALDALMIINQLNRQAIDELFASELQSVNWLNSADETLRKLRSLGQ